MFVQWEEEEGGEEEKTYWVDVYSTRTQLGFGWAESLLLRKLRLDSHSISACDKQ